MYALYMGNDFRWHIALKRVEDMRSDCGEIISRDGEECIVGLSMMCPLCYAVHWSKFTMENG